MKTIDLKKRSGLPMKLDGARLVFSQGMEEATPDVRTLKAMRPVLQDRNAKGKEELYYMYRGVCLQKHKAIFQARKIRYDITILESGKVGKEFVKTFGHFHPVARNNLSYPEIYEVIYGKAEYIMQRENDFVVVDAKPGDKVLIPPNYGHVTVNVGKTPLVMANLVAQFKAKYGPFKRNKGAMYYRTNRWEKNKNYKNAPKPRAVKPPAFGSKPMYSLFIRNPGQFKFLKKP